MNLTPLTGHIGARVTDIPLGPDISTAQLSAIADALSQWKVLVFPGQHLNAETFHGFASRFGPLQHHVLRKYRHERFPGLSWLTNVNADGSVDTFGVRRATRWHSDGSYAQAPPVMGILYALEVPAEGGGTLFADMEHAYRSLDAAERAELQGLTGLHRHGGGPAGDMYDDTLDDDQAEGFEDAVHPAVREHPISGRKVIYVNETHTRKFAERDRDESVALITLLTERSTAPDNVYRHDWSVGDLLMWDQCATVHRGAGDYPPEQRRVKLRAIVESLH